MGTDGRQRGRWVGSQFEKTGNEPSYQLRTAVDAQLVIEPFKMGMHRVWRDAELLGDSLFLVVVEDHLGDIEFARGEVQSIDKGGPHFGVEDSVRCCCAVSMPWRYASHLCLPPLSRGGYIEKVVSRGQCAPSCPEPVPNRQYTAQARSVNERGKGPGTVAPGLFAST